MAVVSMSPPQAHYPRQTCWFYLTIALVVASSALATMLLIKDGFVITNREYIDHVVEECGAEDNGTNCSCVSD